MPDMAPMQGDNSSDMPAWLEGVIQWIKSRDRKILIVAMCFQVVILLGMIAFHSMPLLLGKTVLIRVVPVDPRDFFRGDYVILSYAFSRTPTAQIEGLAGIRNRQLKGRTIYVSLVPEPNGEHWQCEKVSIYPPEGGTFIRGRLLGYDRLHFGIEAFYLQEGTGKEYEKAIRQQRLSAEIAVTSGGRAALRSLRVD